MRDGAKAAGFTFPLVLPRKLEAEAAVRAAGPIRPDPALLARWFQRFLASKLQSRVVAGIPGAAFRGGLRLVELATGRNPMSRL